MNRSSIPDFKRPLCEYSTYMSIIIICIILIVICQRNSITLMFQTEVLTCKLNEKNNTSSKKINCTVDQEIKISTNKLLLWWYLVSGELISLKLLNKKMLLSRILCMN